MSICFFLLPQQLLSPHQISSFIVHNIDSEADSSLLMPSTTDSVLTGLKRGKSAHAIWTHTHTAFDAEPESNTVFTICKNHHSNYQYY